MSYPDTIARASGSHRPGARLDYLKRMRADLEQRAVSHHTCTDACGITYDAGCPVWAAEAEALRTLPRRDPRWQAAAASVPLLVEQYQADAGLADRLRPMVDRLIRAADLLPDELLEVILAAWRAAGAARRRELALLVVREAREEVRDVARDVLADDLPDAVSACMGGRR